MVSIDGYFVLQPVRVTEQLQPLSETASRMQMKTFQPGTSGLRLLLASLAFLTDVFLMLHLLSLARCGMLAVPQNANGWSYLEPDHANQSPVASISLFAKLAYSLDVSRSYYVTCL